MSETTESPIQGGKVISAYKSTKDHYISITLLLPDNSTVDLEPSEDGYGASWIEVR